ncbi:MAG: hypothetical protein LBJ69_02250 [Holosporales bacterium]|jgi:hypothetical protein|nr:hypothetical protein [Holosporales bacterium]
MNKWLLAAGIFVCSMLFFFSGALTGYLIHSNSSPQDTAQKEPRRPSPLLTNAQATLGRVATQRMSGGSTRVPSSAAIDRSRSYGPIATGSMATP